MINQQWILLKHTSPRVHSHLFHTGGLKFLNKSTSLEATECPFNHNKRTKDLNYFSLCVFNLFNTRVSQFELN